jgi:alkylation response protein AidB-like acyl-CoA dehydrogenase
VESWEKELLAAVTKLSRETFVGRAAAIDRDGSFPHANMADLRVLGVPGMTLPEALGGRAVGAEAQMRIIEEIAYGDGSTAVALNMHLLVADFIAAFPPFPRRDTVLRDIATNNVLICAPGSVPTTEVDNRRSGYAVRDEGDAVVFNGKSGFASGSDGAKYTIIGGLIQHEGGDPDFVVTLPELSTQGINVLHNWDAMGLRGTASHDVLVEEMRIPKSEALIIPLPLVQAVRDMQASQTTAESQNRTRGALGILAIWLGLAQAAFDFTVEYVAQRHGYLAGPASPLGPTPGFRAEQAWAQYGIGNMEHWLETGRIVLYDLIRRLDEPFPTAQLFVRQLVRTVYHLRRMSEEISQGAMRVCGAHAYVRNRPLERIFRDMVGGNVMAWKTDELVMSLGQSALGLPISFVGPAGT